MSSKAVEVRGLGKKYRIAAPGSQPGTLAEATLKMLRGGVAREDFWAVRDIDFTVHQGEVVGLVGHNGAGKSTLLKLLSRITEPTEGRDRALRAGRLPARSRQRLPPRADRPRERLHERDHPGDEARGDQ